MDEVFHTFMLAPQPADPSRFLDVVRGALEAAGAELEGPGRGPGLWLYRCPQPGGAAPTLSLTYLRGQDIAGFARPVAMEIECPLPPGDRTARGWLVGALEHLFTATGALISCSGADGTAGETELYEVADALLDGQSVSGPELVHVGPALAGQVDWPALAAAGARLHPLPGGGVRAELDPA